MASLLVRPSAPDRDGRVQAVTPDSAGWSYVGFEVFHLGDGRTLERTMAGREACLVLLAGRMRAAVDAQSFGVIGGRMSPFEGAPWSLYVPAGSAWSIAAEGECEVAVCTAPAQGRLPARVIEPAAVGHLVRGEGTNSRTVRDVLPESEPAESLLVVEVITPPGHWSSYPPHKHDSDALPEESLLEETYYHRLRPPQGFAIQRVYTEDRSLDETLAVSDGDVVLVPRGYHPVAAAHGYELYYLNVMAGPKRAWKFRNDPAHEWILTQA